MVDGSDSLVHAAQGGRAELRGWEGANRGTHPPGMKIIAITTSHDTSERGR